MKTPSGIPLTMKYCENSPAYSETVQAKASASGNSPGRLSFYSLYKSRKKVSYVTLLFVMPKNYSQVFAWSRSFQFLGITLFSAYDPQSSLTISMGWPRPDELDTTLSTFMGKVLEDKPIQLGEGVLHHAEGVDLIPSNIELAGMEVGLVNAMSREKILKQVLEVNKRSYDFHSRCAPVARCARFARIGIHVLRTLGHQLSGRSR